MRMPFGKYRGLEIDDLPTTYLEWLATIQLRPWLREAVEDELEARGYYGHDSARDTGTRRDYGAPRETSQPTVVAVSVALERVALLRELFEAGYRQLALRYHPDRAGGNTARMRELNCLMEAIRQQIPINGTTETPWS
jgi:hypothetical protein